ncbi:hypothetical protein BBA70_02910 [New Jersey aster yellows phytoplasma]|uniref:TLC domain-containing protein n=1 Tax=New Jersey aster yellows phytoplasma TaxID=270520 RepID=A0ABX4K291_9MOLU|nr:hypothetical protein BBA70_02910 [New Jersey aster yellows phytoplasma]
MPQKNILFNDSPILNLKLQKIPFYLLLNYFFVVYNVVNIFLDLFYFYIKNIKIIRESSIHHCLFSFFYTIYALFFKKANKIIFLLDLMTLF